MKRFLSIVLTVCLICCVLPNMVSAADASRILYYNDFEVDVAAYGAGLSLNSNVIEIYEDAKQGKVMKMATPESGVKDDAIWVANFENTFNDVVISMELSTLETTPIVDIVISDVSGKRFQIGRVEKNANILDADYTTIGTVEPGKYHKLSYVLNFEKMTYDTYLDKRKVGSKQEIRSIDSDICWIRLYQEKFANGTLLVDNFAVYEGTKVRDITEEAAALPEVIPMIGAITPGSGKTWQINYADMTKMDGGVALMLDTNSAYAKDELTEIDVAPVVINNRTLVPVRFISENFGADVSWDQQTQTVTVKGDKTLEFTLNNPEMTVDGNAEPLDCAATVIDNRTLLPLRALVEALGKNVFWDARGLILITESDKELDAEIDKRLVTAMYGYLKTGKLELNYAVAPTFTEEAMTAAFEATDFNYNATSGHDSFNTVKAFYYLTLLTHLDENTLSPDGTMNAKDETLRRLRVLIEGGNEPNACIGPYWSQAVVASSLTLLRHTPSLWESLTTDEQQRCDWLMRALAVAGNWGFNDCNNYSTGVDLKGNFGKTWNPNYRNSFLNCVISAAMYFGSEELDEIYESFSYDEYIQKFEEYGYTNIIAAWSVAGKDAMEKGGDVKLVTGASGGTGKGVKQKFKYNGKGLDNIDGIFEDLQNYTYGAVCQDKYGSPDGAYYCYIISGKETPYAGYNGMLFEFAATGRSSGSYCNDSFLIVNSMMANYKLIGGWDSNEEWQQKLDSLMYVGNEDLIFKGQEGYQGYSSNGGPAKWYDYSGGDAFLMDKDIWRNFHCMGSETVTIGLDPNPPAQAVLNYGTAEPKDGITTPPTDAITPTKVLVSGNFPVESVNDIGTYTQEVECEFDLVFDNDIDASTFDGCIIHDGSKCLKNPVGFTTANTTIQFTGGRINVRNGGAYYNTKFPVGANYRYHFRMKIDVDKKTYSVWITPQYPKAGNEEMAANNVEFRTGARDTDDIGSLMAVQVSDKGMYWIENYTCSGK